MGLLYSNMKIFHFKDKIDSLSEMNDRIMPPIHIRIKPTNICNHNCWYCAYKADNIQLGRDMVGRDYIPKEKMMEFIDDIVQMGVKAVTFSGGGEPFCYPFLLEAVKRLSETPVKFSSLTNGSRLDDEIGEVFAHNGTWIRISMDGWDDKSYSFYRRIPDGEFTKIIKNIRGFKKLGGKCFLGVSLIVDKKNASHIYEVSRKLKDVGVDSIKISPCIVSNEREENNKYHRKLFNKVKDEINKTIKSIADNNFEVSDSYYEMNSLFKKNYTWCPYLQILPVVGADQNIYACQDKAYNLKDGLIGSMRDRGFKEFWFSDKNKFFKINPYLHCNHHCIANTKNRLILDYLDTDKDHLEFV